MSKLFTTKADETPEFVAFWKAWQPLSRQNDGRGDARDTFFKHVRSGADPNDIVDGAKAYIRTLKERDREYIPMASTWLNRRAYEDLAEQERAYQERVAEAKGRAANVVPLSQSIPEDRRRQLVAQSRAASQAMRTAADA